MKLLAIDIQKGITNTSLYKYEEFIKNTLQIISCARKNNIEVICVQHDAGQGSGFSRGDNEFEISDYILPLSNEKIFIKNKSSCFTNPHFANYIKNEKELIIIGLQTDFCIDATVKSAFEKGYSVFIPKNANSTFDNDYMGKERTYRYYNEMMWSDRYAKCISVKDTLELLENCHRLYLSDNT